MVEYCAAGMYWPDYEAYLRELDAPLETTPSKDNTLFWNETETTTQISQDISITLTYSSLLAMLTEMTDRTVVHIGRFPTITDIPKAVTKALTDLTTRCEFFKLKPVWPQTRRLSSMMLSQ